MSTKSTIFLSNDYDEHWYNEHSEPLQGWPIYKDAITLEFSKANIRVDENDDDSLIITITNPNCELYNLIKNINK